MKRLIKDAKLFELYSYLVNKNNSDVGLPLGSEISHISALYFVNHLDHYIKEKLRVKGYARYMDDSYFISENKEFLKQVLEEVTNICSRLKININKKKTTIYKTSKGILFLNKHITISDTGKINVWSKYETRKRLNRKNKIIKNKYGKYSENYKIYYSVYKHLKRKKW